MKVWMIAFTANGCETMGRAGKALTNDEVRIFCKTFFGVEGIEKEKRSLSEWTEDAFGQCDAIVFVGATGIAVRAIAPSVKSKDTDPAVICMDEQGRFTIPLLSGHIGGANELARIISKKIRSECVITTATDLNGRFAVDLFATSNALRIGDLKLAKEVSARILAGERMPLFSEIPIIGELPDELCLADTGKFGICITFTGNAPFERTLQLIPADLCIGVGCKRGTSPEKMIEFVRRNLKELGYAVERVSSVSTIDIKSDEPAIEILSKDLNVPVHYYSADELNAVPGEFSGSDFVRSITSVDCVCERAAVLPINGTVVRKKISDSGMTMAVGRRQMKAVF